MHIVREKTVQSAERRAQNDLRLSSSAGLQCAGSMSERDMGHLVDSCFLVSKKAEVSLDVVKSVAALRFVADQYEPVIGSRRSSALRKDADDIEMDCLRSCGILDTMEAI